MARQIKFLIGGRDYTPYVDLESISADNNVIMTSDSASLTIQLDGETVRPRAGQEFIWSIVDPNTGTEIDREFGGVVVNVEESTEGMSLLYSLSIKSYIHWFDRHLVSAWYDQDYASNIVTKIVNQFPNYNNPSIHNFTTNNVQSSSAKIIPQYFNYTKPSDAIKNVADQLEWGFFIDYYRDVHLYPAEFFTSPLPNNILDVENDMMSFGDLILKENGDQTFNKVILRGFKTRSSGYINLTFEQADTVTTQWSLGYRVSSVKGDVNVGLFPSVASYNSDTTFQATGKVTASGATQMTIKRDIIDGAPDQVTDPTNTIAFIHFTQHLLRLSLPPAVGAVVAIHAYYMKDQIFMGQDIQAQNKLASIETTANYNSDGCYEYSAEDKSLTNSTISAITSKAELMLRKYHLPQIQGSFISFLSGWRAGQYFRLITKKRMGGLDTIMYVQRVTKTVVSSGNGQYVTQNIVEFADSPYLV